MRIQFIIVLILCSLIGQAQKDTIVYFSNLKKVTGSKNDALYYCELKQGKKGNLILSEFAAKDNKWTNVNETNIKKETDTSYSYFHTQNKKKKIMRSFIKTDSGFYVRDYSDTMLIGEGFSKTLFPLIRDGRWKEYSQSDGRLKTESQYRENQLITNKYFIPGGGYINDVFTTVDKLPEYEGGDSELLKFVGENTKYPEKARDNNITGRVIVCFVLMADGSIQGIDFLQRVNFLLDLEALRVINLIPKNKWKPAEIENKKVNIAVMIPITFSLH